MAVFTDIFEEEFTLNLIAFVVKTPDIERHVKPQIESAFHTAKSAKGLT